MPDKILTVIVPSYNMEEYLPKCLGSLIVPDKAMLQQLDVIVVNDGSKDHTSEIAHDFEKRYPGVFRVIDKENGNYGSCINAALPLAMGFYVKVLDADDSVVTKNLQQQLHVLNSEFLHGKNSSDLIVSDYATVNTSGEVLRSSQFNLNPPSVKSLEDIGNIRPVFPCIEIHSIVYKTSIFKSIPYKQTEGISYTDVQWDILPMTAVNRVVYFPNIVTLYLIGRDGQSMNPVTYAKRFCHMVRMAEDVVARYPCYLEQCKPQSLTYFTGQVNRLLEVVYHGVLFGIHGQKASGALSTLETLVTSIPSLFRFTEELCYESKLFPVRYVHEWRARKSLWLPRYLLFRFFVYLRCFKQKVTSFFRKHISQKSY